MRMGSVLLKNLGDARRLSEKESVELIGSELPSGRWSAIISVLLDQTSIRLPSGER
jgi:hypothetical protein